MHKTPKLKKLLKEATFHTEGLMRSADRKSGEFVRGMIKGMELSDWSEDDYYIRDQSILILKEIVRIQPS